MMSTEQISDIWPASRSLGDRFVAHLAREIVSGGYAVGADLPAESAFSLQFGVSKPTVRQGMRALAGLGLVRIQHGKRTVVLDEASWDVLDPVVHEAFAATGRAAELSGHLWALREVLEAAAAGWAADRAAKPQAARLLALAKELTDLAHRRDIERFLETDRAFHELVYAVAGNMALAQVSRPVHRFLSGQLWSPSSQVQPDQLEQLALQHQRVAEAISGGDEAGARRAMTEHILYARDIEMSRLESSS
jgi:GntR family galactonate operon transcriptional repressor